MTLANVPTASSSYKWNACAALLNEPPSCAWPATTFSEKHTCDQQCTRGFHFNC